MTTHRIKHPALISPLREYRPKSDHVRTVTKTISIMNYPVYVEISFRRYSRNVSKLAIYKLRSDRISLASRDRLTRCLKLAKDTRVTVLKSYVMVTALFDHKDTSQ